MTSDPLGRKALAAAVSIAAALALGSCGTARFGAQSVSPVASGPAGAPTGVAPSSRPSPRPGHPVRRLAGVLEELVAGEDGTHITARQAVLTTWGPALAVATPGDSDNEDPTVPVYVIRAIGRFSGAGHSRPYGAKIVPATVVTAVVDARTFTVTDESESDSRGDLSSLGSVFTLPAAG